MHDMVLATRRSSLKQITILLTDGKSNRNSANTIPYANDAKADDITMIVLGSTDRINNNNNFIIFVYVYDYLFSEFKYIYIYIYIYLIEIL